MSWKQTALRWLGGTVARTLWPRVKRAAKAAWTELKTGAADAKEPQA